MERLDSSWVNVSISHGTMRDEDIIAAISLQDWPEGLNLLLDKLIGDYNLADEDARSFILNEDIWDLLNEWAPEGCYFGSSQGDGADFGFWEVNGD